MIKPVALLALSLITVILSCTGSVGPDRGSPQIVIAGEFPLERDGGVGATDASRAVAIALAGYPTLDGYRLSYEPLDDSLAGTLSPDKAEQNATIMVRDPIVLGAVGPWNSLNARVAVPITDQASVVMLSPSTTLACLTARPKACLAGDRSTANNFFRIAATDPQAVRAEADVAVRKLGLTKFAVITDGAPIYGEVIGASFADEVATDGGHVVLRQTYSPTDQDLKPLLRTARNAGAEAIFVGGFDGDGACRVRAAMNGVFPADAYFFSGDGIVSTACLADAGAAADDHLVASVSARQPVTVPPALRSLRNTGFIDAYVFAAYDCAKILVAAIDRAIKQNHDKIPTRERVLAEVAATQDFKGLTGTFSFNANGDATDPAVSLYHVSKGTWTFWQNA